MVITRIISLVLRVAQLVFAVIVLGLSAYFVHESDGLRLNFYPNGRIIYTLIVSILAVITSLVGMIPKKSSIASSGGDLFFTVVWIAAFGVMVDYARGIKCGDVGQGISFRGSRCGQWNALSVFCFLSAICWLMSCGLGVFSYTRMKRDATARGDGHVTIKENDGAPKYQAYDHSHV